MVVFLLYQGLLKPVREKWIFDDATIQVESWGGKNFGNHWFFLSRKPWKNSSSSIFHIGELIPVWESDIFAARNASQCVLEFEKIDAMPSREKNCVMPAISSPPLVVVGVRLISRFVERHAVQASEVKEGVLVIGWKSLNASECPNEVFKHRMIAIFILVLDPCDRLTNAACAHDVLKKVSIAHINWSKKS